jgi:Tol biopolymer transport system component
MDADGPTNETHDGRQRRLGATFHPQAAVVFASTRTGNGDIYAVDVSGTGPYRRLTATEGEREMIPAFNQDGTKIAFVAERDGGRDIWAMEPDGTRQVRLTRNLSGAWAPRYSVDRQLYAAIGYFTLAWSPDGGAIAYTHVGASGTGQIGILSLAR